MLERIATILARRRFNFANEDELQRGIAQVLEEHHIDFAREVSLDARSRIDFMIGDVGVEVKISCPIGSMIRQLARYAGFDRVRELLLLSTSRRFNALPSMVAGKPLTVIHLGGTF